MDDTIKLYGGAVEVKFQPNPYHRYYVTDEEYGLKKQYTRGVTTFIGIKDKSNALISWATETAGLHLFDTLRDKGSIDADDIIEAMGQHRKIKEKAGDIGTRIHDWCEVFIKHKIGVPGYEDKPQIPEDPQEKQGVKAFLSWVTQHDVKFVDSEFITYHRELKYIGTADCLALVDGELSLVDFKTSNGLYNDVMMQTAAYVKAWEHEHDKQIVNRWALRLAKETEEEHFERHERKCFIKGKDPVNLPPYQLFEFMKFEGREQLEKDFNAFCCAKSLFEWDYETDFYRNRKKK